MCNNNLDPVVQNFTKLLTKVTSNFLSRNMANTLICFAEKNVSSYSHFLQRNINVFENTSATTVNEFVLNELVKLTML